MVYKITGKDKGLYGRIAAQCMGSWFAGQGGASTMGEYIIHPLRRDWEILLICTSIQYCRSFQPAL